MLTQFLRDLFEHGRVQVDSEATISTDDEEEAQGFLIATDAVRRRSLPAELPEFQSDAALQAALRIFHACRFLVYRDIESGEIANSLSNFAPNTDSPAEHYSADLCLQFANDVLRLSRAASDDDPLNYQLLNMLKNWPLSAVGTPAECENRVVILGHRSLKLMYLDRIVRRNDKYLLEHSEIKSALTESAGMHTELLPAVLQDESAEGNDVVG